MWWHGSDSRGSENDHMRGSKYDESVKSLVVALYEGGESLSSIQRKSGVSRDTIYRWLNLKQEKPNRYQRGGRGGSVDHRMKRWAMYMVNKSATTGTDLETMLREFNKFVRQTAAFRQMKGVKDTFRSEQPEVEDYDDLGDDEEPPPPPDTVPAVIDGVEVGTWTMGVKGYTTSKKISVGVSDEDAEHLIQEHLRRQSETPEETAERFSEAVLAAPSLSMSEVVRIMEPSLRMPPPDPQVFSEYERFFTPVKPDAEPEVEEDESSEEDPASICEMCGNMIGTRFCCTHPEA